MNTTTRRTIGGLVAVLLTVLAGLTACSLIQRDPPCTGCVPPPVTTQGLEFDYTGSAQGTDLVQIAEKFALQLIATLPTGEALVVSGFTSDVTVPCNPLVVSIPPQNNPQQERALRSKISAEFPEKFTKYTECLAEHGRKGRSEIFGGITDFFARYPEATHLVAVTDGCENVAVPVICRNRVLTAKGAAKQIVGSLPHRLVPRLDAGVTIEYAGIGRGTGLTAPAVDVLRTVWSSWTAETGATATFDAT
jgi:hypothetical protein